MPRRALAGACLSLALVGCSPGGDVLPLTAWTLETDRGSSPVTLPAHLGDRVAEGSRYALATDVQLPPELRDRDLTLAIPFLLTNPTVEADGNALVALDPGELYGYRGEGFARRWRLPAAAAHARVKLRMTIEHRWTQSAWIDTIPRLSATPAGDDWFLFVRRFNRVTAIAGLSMAMFTGYLYLVVFLSDRRRAAYGWFALTGFACLSYPVHVLGLGQGLLGGAETSTVVLGVTLAVVASVRFTQTFFEIEKPVARAWLLSFAAIALGAVVFHGPFDTTPMLGPPVVATLLASVAYQAIVLVRFLRLAKVPRHALMLVAPWLVFAIISLPDLVAWLGLGELFAGLRTACLGMVVIALFQTAALSREHTVSLRRADDLSREREGRIRQLEAHARQVDLLNEELRHQVSARSAQLAETLAKIGTSTGSRELQPGDVVEERYRVVHVIGSGGAGTVYRVIRLTDEQPLALKIIQGKTSSISLARLAREAQLAAQIHHDNVISIVDVDIATAGYLFIVMELVDGPSLRGHRHRFGDVAWALPVLEQIAAGLAAIHAQGVVHRDLKPANILLVTSEAGGAPRVKIADFGIATLAPEQSEPVVDRGVVTVADPQSDAITLAAHDEGSLTNTGALLGTPLYMAPEIAFGAKHAAPSVDLFSFGVIACELLTGTRPFEESPAFAIYDGRPAAPAPSLASRAPALDPRLVELVNRCLSFVAELRPTAAEVHEVLVALAKPPPSARRGAVDFS